MRPKVIMHTQISLDGCVRGFEDTGIYYLVANRFNADMVLFGSETVYKAAENVPPETEKAFIKPAPKPDDNRVPWIIPDSRGRLRNLHVFRDTPYCKDIVLLISETTPKSYIEYLTQRNYDYILAGADHVDYAAAFETLYDKYNCRVIRTDSGGILTNVLLEQGLVDEVSLVISPCLVGKDMPHVFRSLSLNENIKLKLVNNEVIEENYLSLIYEVI